MRCLTVGGLAIFRLNRSYYSFVVAHALLGIFFSDCSFICICPGLFPMAVEESVGVLAASGSMYPLSRPRPTMRPWVALVAGLATYPPMYSFASPSTVCRGHSVLVRSFARFLVFRCFYLCSRTCRQDVVRLIWLFCF